jgi:hypothetical protein
VADEVEGMKDGASVDRPDILDAREAIGVSSFWCCCVGDAISDNRCISEKDEHESLDQFQHLSSDL